MWSVLSDRARPALVAAVVAGLLGLGASWVRAHHDGRVGHLRLLEHPEEHDGERLVLSLVRVDAVLGPDLYRVSQGTLRFEVAGDSSVVEVGSEVTILGRWDGSALRVDADEVIAAPGRGGKKRLGLAGLAATAALLPAWFRLTRRGIAVRG